MLNYVWLTLILLGIGVALTTDIIDKTENKYRNGEQLPVEIIFEDSLDGLANQKYDVNVRINENDFSTFYDLLSILQYTTGFFRMRPGLF